MKCTPQPIKEAARVIGIKREDMKGGTKARTSRGPLSM